jgi:hypothetical protein
MKVDALFHELKFNYRAFFIVFLIVFIAQVIDQTIGTLADILWEFMISFWGVALFFSISAIYVIGQYLILGMVKAKNKEKEIRRKQFNTLERALSIVQHILVAILVLVSLQIIFESQYSTGLLRIGIVVSYGLAVTIMGLLSYFLFSWFRVNRSVIVLLYGSAALIISVYVISVALIFDIALQEKSAVFTPQSEVVFSEMPPGRIDDVLNSLQTYCSIIYFFLIWGGTILLLRENTYRIGKIKFWMLMSSPLVAWTIFSLLFYQVIDASLPIEFDPITELVVPLLLMMSSQIAALILIGANFRSVARAIRIPIIKDYMMITAYGFILFFTATFATISAAGYPPFGFVNVLLLGPFSFLVLSGLYRSAVCVAEDAKLRQSIKALARRESSLIDIAAAAEIQKEVQDKVVLAVRASAKTLQEQSGVESSLTDAEIQNHLKMVVQELRNSKLKNE